MEISTSGVKLYKMSQKTGIRFIVLLAILAGFAVLVSADFDPNYILLCLQDGQSVPNASTPYYTCDLRFGGFCQVCARASNWDPRGVDPTKRCDQQTCHFVNGTVDEVPPTFNILEPINGTIYQDSTVRVHVTVDNEFAELDRYDVKNQRWVTMCDLCDNFNRDITFGDGPQTLRIRATDARGNPAEKTVSFFVDERSPSITDTEPTRGFSDGTLYVQFDESNPVSLTLFYGNLIVGMRQLEVDRGLFCAPEGTKTGCTVQVNVADFHGQFLDYWFSLTDIAGNVDTSDVETLSVDIAAPIFTGVQYDIDGKFVDFLINLTEQYFDELDYIDHDDSKTKLTKMCSQLVDGACHKKVSFKDGPHNLTLYAFDQVNNSATYDVSFITDTKDPKISKTEPKRGFTNGNFYIELKEANPERILVHFNSTHEVDIASECTISKDKYSCDTNADVSSHNGGVISYYVEVIDRLGKTGVSRSNTVEVDTVFPVINHGINSPGSMFTISGSRVTFNISITELNFDEATYVDWSDSRPRERGLCSRLTNGYCTSTKSFRSGMTHDLTIQVYDEAGNTVAESISFDIV